MNLSHKGFIQIFSSMWNDISTNVNNQTLEDNESLTETFYSNIFFNVNEIFTSLTNQTLEDNECFTLECYSNVLKNSNRIFPHG
jgi:hypothetical protein